MVKMDRRGMALLALAHTADDINQGFLPAVLPLLILTYHFSLQAAGALVLAQAISSSVIQPAIGHLADKRPMPWLIWSGLLLAGLGIALRSCIGIRTPAAGVDPPHWTDFWLYGAAPAAIYVGIAAVAAAIALGLQLTWAAMAIAGLVLILLLVGIRNAWDLVTFIAPMRKEPPA